MSNPPLDKLIVNEILAEVQVKLNEIFGVNLLFGFVCGGFSKGYADDNHDVDTFMCVKNLPNHEVKEEYLKWYFDLHKRYNIKPDYDYPGEIVTYEYLTQTLELLKSLTLTLEIKGVQTKKAIIWADMITGFTAAETGSDLELLRRLKNEYKDYPEKWKQEVLNLIPIEYKEKWQNKSHLLIMEHFMKYPKQDGQKLEGKY